MGSKKQKRLSVQSTPAQNSGAGEMSPALIVLAIALFVLTRFYILFFFHPQVSDISMYFEFAVRAIDFKQTPYTENFVVPYPPLAYWTTCAPRMFDDRRITSNQDPQIAPIYIDYVRGFRGMMFLCDLASFVMLLLIARKRCPQLAGWAAVLYTITTAILCHVLYDRLDVGLLMLLMLGVYFWTRSLAESGRTITWIVAAYGLIGLSISFKIIPVICVPFLLLSEFHAPRRLTRLTSALIALSAAICVPFIIQYAASGPGVFTIFKFHAERNIQLESLYSTLMMIASLFGTQVFVSHSHGAFDLSGDLSSAMLILSKILLGGFLAGTGLWALLQGSRFSRQDAYRLTCYIIPAAVILSIVISPQYFIWAIPLLLLLGIEILPAGRVSPWILGALLVAVAVMTTWIFPYNYFCTESTPHGLVPLTLTDHLDPSALTVYTILGLRGFTYLGIVLWLGVMLFINLRKTNVSTMTDQTPVFSGKS